ncbi:DUF6680 family protein [Xylophilus sp. GOD-11R]|uniref:DUF6680 family protein n=1 Tax=Xylophilus sp. GOD-11R TaxID=3089814 RepID=UPI00298D56BD|nr:DUF6680 family protein [Xylophilus sp. GOD-11R]WPB58723.1 DUF6680 family protein [Xylophilus sp. GOD-11R]
MSFTDMGANEWLIVSGAVLGPILAVQVQKLVEALGEDKKRREAVFAALMATRQSRLSHEHVGALNSIDLTFYDRGFWLLRWHPRTFQLVREAWMNYRRHLSPPPAERATEGEALARFQGRAEELFVNLLEKMAVAVGYSFDRQELQTGSYSPEAHGRNEQQQIALRETALAFFAGRQPLSMEVTQFPSDPALTARAIATQELLAGALAELAKSLDQRPNFK